MTHITLANATNVTNYVILEHETLDHLTTAIYHVDLGLTGVFLALAALIAVFTYTKNYGGIMGVGVLLIGYAFTLPFITGITAVDFTFVVMLGVSILFTAIFTYRKQKKGENA